MENKIEAQKATQTAEEQKTKQNEILASDVLGMLKSQLRFMKVMVVILVLLLAGTNIFHIWQWSQFDTIVVDSGESGGYANYVGGDNTGGVYNGESSSQTQEEGQKQGNAS